MIRAPRPRGVCKRVVQILLKVVHDMILEFVGIVGEQSNASSSLYG
jgi:hypothetical protein